MSVRAKGDAGQPLNSNITTSESIWTGAIQSHLTIGEDWWTSGTSYEGYIVYSYDDSVNNGLTVTDVTTLGAGTASTAGQPNTGTPGLFLSQTHFS